MTGTVERYDSIDVHDLNRQAAFAPRTSSFPWASFRWSWINQLKVNQWIIESAAGGRSRSWWSGRHATLAARDLGSSVHIVNAGWVSSITPDHSAPAGSAAICVMRPNVEGSRAADTSRLSSSGSSLVATLPSPIHFRNARAECIRQPISECATGRNRLNGTLVQASGSCARRRTIPF